MKIQIRRGSRVPLMRMWPGEFKVSFGVKMFMICLLIGAVSFINVAWATGIGVAAFGFGLVKEDEDAIKAIMEGVADKHKAAVKTEIEVAIKGLQTNEQFAAKMEALGLKDGVIAAMEKALKEQGEELRKFIEEKGKGQEKSFEEVLKEQHTLGIKKLSSEGGRFKFTLPGVRKTTVIRTAITDSSQGYLIPEIGQLPYLGAVMSNLFRHVQLGADTGGVVKYVDQEAITRNAAAKAENTQAPESVITWIERTMNVQKIMDSIPVSKEMLKDFGFVKGELDRLLDINLALKEDDYFWDGSGVAPISKGIYTYAPAFVPATYADKTTNANLYDLIACVRVDIMNSKQSKYLPSVVIMNPADILLYKLKKGVDGHYVLPPFISQNGSIIDGIRVVESSQVTANTLVVGDTRYGTIYDLEGTEIEIGHIDKQFVEDTMTMKATKRTSLLVRNVDLDAFSKVTDIAAALDTIGPAA